MEPAAQLILGVACVAVAVVTVGFLASVPRRRAFLKGRTSCEELWRQEGPPLPDVERVLAMVCEAFVLRRDDVWLLRPDDTLRAIYEAMYPPRLGLPDAREIEVLTREAAQRFSVSHTETERWVRSNPTLGEVVDVCLMAHDRVAAG